MKKIGFLSLTIKYVSALTPLVLKVVRRTVPLTAMKLISLFDVIFHFDPIAK